MTYRKKILFVLMMLLSSAFMMISVQAAGSIPWVSTDYSDPMTMYIGGGIDSILCDRDSIDTKQAFTSSSPSVARPNKIRVFYDYKWNATRGDYDHFKCFAVYMKLLKPGKTTLTYHDEYGLPQKGKLTVKAYTNPLKELIIPGVKSGKNLASLFGSKRSARSKVNVEGKKGKISVKAAYGWGIGSLQIKNLKSGLSYGNIYGDQYPGDKKASCKLSLRSPLKKNGRYRVNIDLQNEDNCGVIRLIMYIGTN